MSALIEYLRRADTEEKRVLLRKQYEEATHEGTITCACGWQRALTMAYRCLYCGVYFCQPCAELHFGQTIKEWDEQKAKAKTNIQQPTSNTEHPMWEQA